MEAQVTRNCFCTYTGAQSQVDTTVFFISGNPGLIGYYHPFLSLLAQHLAGPKQGSTQKASTSFQIYGCSLGGFEVADNGDERGSSASNGSRAKDTADGKNRFYDLEEQICFVQDTLNQVMSKTASSAPLGKKQKVILIGHSVGTYMAMEILRRHREATTQSTSSPDFDITGAVMLFPTVMDIQASPSGQKLTTLLSMIPQLALVVSIFARVLTLILPDAILKSVIRLVMKNPPPHALDTTFTFLKSPGGVRQALHMAADEMRTITTDKWSDDVWGVASTRDPVAKLFFYFGRNDHWVAEKTRDDIIALKGRQDGLGPKMLVCEEGLPHAFCLKHNEIMATKVAGMIREIESS
ncbi:hypothetical protein N7532_007827 [Penicillium argentinense]|uniref:Lipid droplet-associated hydrolase n=1 Tax=Penicillium argentinense TaxID=1131581 RepID=A0A9W9K116_9EURO|nr:uncharacterized protein N7532_007827 [Penicillium argentinense]KAJ5089143.1 hypothetical protein N7532_007827 [Penicillium argentinense]